MVNQVDEKMSHLVIQMRDYFTSNKVVYRLLKLK
jgi:hypothetical protein